MNGTLIGLTAAFATLLMPAAGAATTADGFQTGRWLHTTRLSTDGEHWFPAKEEQGCLSPAQAGDIEGQVRSQLTAAGCTPTRLTLRNGLIKAELACSGAAGARVTVSGRYDRRSYGIDFRSDGGLDLSALGGIPGLPLQLIGHTSGKYIGPC